MYNGQDKRPEEYKRVWKEDGNEKKEPSPTDLVGQDSQQIANGEFSFGDHFSGSLGGWGGDDSHCTVTPWGIQLAEVNESNTIPIENNHMMSATRDSDIMMFNPSSLGSMGSAPTVGSMGSMEAALCADGFLGVMFL